MLPDSQAAAGPVRRRLWRRGSRLLHAARAAGLRRCAAEAALVLLPSLRNSPWRLPTSARQSTINARRPFERATGPPSSRAAWHTKADKRCAAWQGGKLRQNSWLEGRSGTPARRGDVSFPRTGSAARCCFQVEQSCAGRRRPQEQDEVRPQSLPLRPPPRRRPPPPLPPATPCFGLRPHSVQCRVASFTIAVKTQDGSIEAETDVASACNS